MFTIYYIKLEILILPKLKNTLFNLILISLLILATSCSQNKEEMLKNLPGYWEIESVKNEDGALKEFKISTTIDFIELNGNEGLRTKVNPQLDGSFINNGTTENFSVDKSGEKLVLNYDNTLDQWSEKVIEVTKTSLIVTNAAGKEYRYKRFEKFDFNLE